MKRSLPGSGLPIIGVVIALTLLLGFLARRSSVWRQYGDEPKPSVELIQPDKVKLTAWGTDTRKAPAIDSPAVRQRTAFWLKLETSRGSKPKVFPASVAVPGAAASPPGVGSTLSTAIETGGGEPLAFDSVWRGADLYLLILRGYASPPKRALLRVSEMGSTLAVLPLPAIPPSPRVPAPPVGPAWPDMSARACAPFDTDSRPAVAIRANLPPGHIIVEEPIGPLTETTMRGDPNSYLVADAAFPPNTAVIVRPDIPYPKSTRTTYMRFTELAAEDRAVHVSFSTSQALTRFGEPWFDKWLEATSDSPRIQFQLMPTDRVPLRKPRSRRPTLTFELHGVGASSKARAGDPNQAVIIGRAKVRRIRPTRYADQSISIINTLESYDGYSAGRYPPPPALAANGWGNVPPPETDARQMPDLEGKLGQPLQLDLDFSIFRVVRTAILAIDLSAPTPIGSLHRNATMVLALAKVP